MNYKNPLPPPSVAIPKITEATSLPPHIEQAGAVALAGAAVYFCCGPIILLIYGLVSLR